MANLDISDPSFPDRLVRLRRRAGLSKEDLAERAEVSERTIRNWESGVRERALESALERVAAVLGVSVEYLLHGRRRERRVAFALAIAAAAGIVGFAVLHHGKGPDKYRHDHLLAYRDYVAGREYLKRLYRDEARAAFHSAVGRDSSFAMAWAMLAHPELWTTKEEYRYYARKAESLADKCTEQERMMIEALRLWTCDDVEGCVARLEDLVERYPDEAEAYRLLARHYSTLGDAARAAACLQAAVEADPTDGMSHNRLAYFYERMGDVERALASARRYRDLQPTEANPYDTIGDILRRAGRWDEAIASYREALARRGDYAPSLQSLGHMYTMAGRWQEAEALYARELESPDVGARSRARVFMACVPVHAGRFGVALARVDAAIAEDRAEGFSGEPFLQKLHVKALVLYEQGDVEGALDAWKEMLDIAREGGMEEVDQWTGDYVMMLAGRDAERAETYVETVPAQLSSASPFMNYIGLAARGWLDLSRGAVDDARDHLERAREYEECFSVLYPLVLAYERAGDHAEAVGVLRRALTRCTDQIYYGPWVAKSHYRLALNLEALGRIDESREELKRFVDLWAGADHECEELETARRKLALATPSKSAPTGR